MGTINRLLSFIGILAIFFLFFAINLLFGIWIISLMIVPITWLWSKLIGKNYYVVIDSSNMLYKLNVFGQWAWLISIGLMVTYYVFWSKLF